MKIERANNAAETLEELLSAFSSRCEGIQAEAYFEDEDNWPIAAWEMDDKEEDEITRACVQIRVQVLDEDRHTAASLINEIRAVAAEAGFPLAEKTDSRWSAGRDRGVQINLESADF